MLNQIVSQLNIASQCKKYGLSFWQCPQFLFLVMGVIIIFSTISSYVIGNRFVDDPLAVAMMTILVSFLLFIIAIMIIQNFEKLAEANRLKSEFVSIVSHQLRSPLSNLKWVTELLMSGNVDSISEKQLGYLKILKENNDRMVNLVSDLLTVSRIEQGTLSFKKQQTSLKDLAEKVVRRVELFAGASNVAIETAYEENLPQTLLDADQIEIVIENLLDNAIRYTRPAEIAKAEGEAKARGLVEIKIGVRKGRLYFEIKDNGVGVPKEDKKYIFQKFFRSHNIMRYQTAGSGLGLYIVKSIIKKSGGEIGFKSQEGVGSTFWFTLPIIK